MRGGQEVMVVGGEGVAQGPTGAGFVLRRRTMNTGLMNETCITLFTFLLMISAIF